MGRSSGRERSTGSIAFSEGTWRRRERCGMRCVFGARADQDRGRVESNCSRGRICPSLRGRDREPRSKSNRRRLPARHQPKSKLASRADARLATIERSTKFQGASLPHSLYLQAVASPNKLHQETKSPDLNPAPHPCIVGTHLTFPHFSTK